GPRRRGRRVAYAVDTRPVESLVELCRGVDIAFLDGMFHSAEAEHAREKGHMTVSEAARAARKAGAGRCVLVHLSPRYQDEDLERLQQEAWKEHSGAAVGRDLQRFDVPLPGDEAAP
ncbi:MAG: MBL fold metallo-hydrolase, partial [Thermodesulfobacteriota bacterium]|nr:MBL fold metallo-hydrolase [Thermodesulfobacteriota bacterium]